jgi:hypothetical protein
MSVELHPTIKFINGPGDFDTDGSDSGVCSAGSDLGGFGSDFGGGFGGAGFSGVDAGVNTFSGGSGDQGLGCSEYGDCVSSVDAGAISTGAGQASPDFSNVTSGSQSTAYTPITLPTVEVRPEPGELATAEALNQTDVTSIAYQPDYFTLTPSQRQAIEPCYAYPVNDVDVTREDTFLDQLGEIEDQTIFERGGGEMGKLFGEGIRSHFEQQERYEQQGIGQFNSPGSQRGVRVEAEPGEAIP